MRRIVSVIVPVAETWLPCHREGPHGERKMQLCQSDTLKLTRSLPFMQELMLRYAHVINMREQTSNGAYDGQLQASRVSNHLARGKMGNDILYRRRQCLVLIRRHGHLSRWQIATATPSTTSADHAAKERVLAGVAGVADTADTADVADVADNTAVAGVCSVVAR